MIENGEKYLVQRRDGSVPEWPYFVLGARDPCAHFALIAYAKAAEALGLDEAYVRDVQSFAIEFHKYRKAMGDGDPDAALAHFQKCDYSKEP